MITTATTTTIPSMRLKTAKLLRGCILWSGTGYADNPRHNDAGVDAVAASIREFGFRQPIVVDEHSVIIVGHTRYKAAQKLGLEKVPVHVATGLTPEQVRAYRIADNQTATLSAWDDDKLVKELLALQEQGFDLDLTGFSGDDLLRLFESSNVPQGDPDADSGPARRSDHAARRSLDSRQPPLAVWRFEQARGRRSAARRRPDPSWCNTDPPYNVECRAAVEQRDRRRPVSRFRARSITRRWTSSAIPEKAKGNDQEDAGQGPAARQRLRVR